MSAITVTLGADLTAPKRGMAGAAALVKSSARTMGEVTGASLAGLGKGGAAALKGAFKMPSMHAGGTRRRSDGTGARQCGGGAVDGCRAAGPRDRPD